MTFTESAIFSQNNVAGIIEMDTRTLKITGITRAEIASAVEQIVAAVADEHGLVEARDGLTLRSNLHDDLGMDELDLIEVLFHAEERFGLVLPDNEIGPSSTVGDVVDLIIARLREKEAHLAQAQDSKEAWKELPEQEQPESCHNVNQRRELRCGVWRSSRAFTSPARTSGSGR
jgi:acyl carrier protein